MPQTFTFDLISPERVVVSGAARMATIPGEAGEFGVLPGHMPLLAALKPGVLCVEMEGEGMIRRLFVAGGFADVTPGRCVVLAEDCMPVDRIDLTAVEADLRDLEDERSAASGDAERKKLEARIAVETARARARRSS